REKVHEYFEEFHRSEGSSLEKIEEINRINEQNLQQEEKNNQPKQFYHEQHEKIQSQAHQQGLARENIVDKRPAEGVGKMIVEETLKIDGDQKKLKSDQDQTIREVQKNQ